ncbi:hypothetical protein FHL15_004916 [Xylaria flabelliformis]|uniref:Uncharacterized protein n=1 Tax=Xylaria flabelliformis TaxID=2512241 RepID=A0A553I1S6_9PEZI|nr:hypothetical protein FHL15_004916 [Xylaria flabelliformis]
MLLQLPLINGSASRTILARGLDGRGPPTAETLAESGGKYLGRDLADREEETKKEFTEHYPRADWEMTTAQVVGVTEPNCSTESLHYPKIAKSTKGQSNAEFPPHVRCGISGRFEASIAGKVQDSGARGSRVDVDQGNNVWGKKLYTVDKFSEKKQDDGRGTDLSERPPNNIDENSLQGPQESSRETHPDQALQSITHINMAPTKSVPKKSVAARKASASRKAGVMKAKAVSRPIRMTKTVQAKVNSAIACRTMNDYELHSLRTINPTSHTDELYLIQTSHPLMLCGTPQSSASISGKGQLPSVEITTRQSLSASTACQGFKMVTSSGMQVSASILASFAALI